MKWIFRITLGVSLGLNVYFIVEEVKYYRIRELEKALNSGAYGKFTNTPWKEGFDLFKTKVLSDHPGHIDKKYYYINVWTGTCKPCIKEMPWLDSLAGKINKDVGYFFVTEMKDDAAAASLKRTNFKIRNFVFLNDMQAFVSAAQKQQGGKFMSYPTIYIINNRGEMVYSSTGAYGNARQALGFIELINRLD